MAGLLYALDEVCSGRPVAAWHAAAAWAPSRHAAAAATAVSHPTPCTGTGAAAVATGLGANSSSQAASVRRGRAVGHRPCHCQCQCQAAIINRPQLVPVHDSTQSGQTRGTGCCPDVSNKDPSGIWRFLRSEGCWCLGTTRPWSTAPVHRPFSAVVRSWADQRCVRPSLPVRQATCCCHPQSATTGDRSRSFVDVFLRRTASCTAVSWRLLGARRFPPLYSTRL